MTRHMGKSLLPSEGRDTFDVVDLPGGRVQVRACEGLETYVLLVLHDGGGVSVLAGHANGHSCRELARRMASGNLECALAQRTYILACGGFATRESWITCLMGIESA